MKRRDREKTWEELGGGRESIPLLWREKRDATTNTNTHDRLTLTQRRSSHSVVVVRGEGEIRLPNGRVFEKTGEGFEGFVLESSGARLD